MNLFKNISLKAMRLMVLLSVMILISCQGSPMNFLGNIGLDGGANKTSEATTVAGMEKIEGLWYAGYKDSNKLCGVKFELNQVNGQFPVSVGTGCPEEFAGLSHWNMAQNQVVLLRADNSPVVIFSMIKEKHWEGVSIATNKILKLLR